MKILIVSPSLDATRNVSGVSSVTNFIIKNNEGMVYSHFLQGKSDDESGAFSRIRRIIYNYRKWKNLLDGLRETVVHYNFPLDTFSIIRDFFFLKAAKKKKVRMTIHLHGGLYLFKEKKPFFINKALKTIFSWDYPIIALSNKEKEKIQTTYNAKHVYVLPNCIDLSASSTFFRENSPQKLEILYIGRIEPNKGIDYIYDALSILNTSDMNFMLHFAGKEQGDRHYIRDFEQLLGNKFIYEGIVSGKQKDDLLKKCNVFLLPSFYEGLPMSLLECMSFGMVPVTTNVGSIEDFVENGKTGLFVKIKDSDSIVSMLTRLYDDPVLLEELSKGAREKIFATLNPQEYISKLNWIYDNC